MSSSTTGGRPVAGGRGGGSAGRAARAVGVCGGAVVLALGVVGTASASTTTGEVVAVPLDPAHDGVESCVVPVENLPGLQLTDVVGTDAYDEVPLDPGGVVRISLPEGLEVADPSGVTLRMVDIDDPRWTGPRRSSSPPTAAAP